MKIENKKLCFRKRSGCCRSFFTIIELVAAMAVFSVIMLVMMKFFGSAQKAWTGSAAKSQIFEDAKLAMDMISRDLQSAVYVRDHVPFANYSSENRVALISATSMKQNDRCLPTSEVQYKLDPSDGFLKRSVIGNKNDDGDDNTTTYNYTDWAGTPMDNTIFNDADWHKVIPYVTKLEFKTYKYEYDGGTVLKLTEITKSDTDFTNFPNMIVISMSLIDKNTYAKYDVLKEAGETTQADKIKTENERTFTKMIFLGDQGQ